MHVNLENKLEIPLNQLHVDLFGPMDVSSMGGKSYGFVIVDDYCRFIWVDFLTHKDEALHIFIRHCKKIQNVKRPNSCKC